MHKSKYFLAIAILFVSVPRCLPQVLAPPEIQDPAMRALQQQHLPELKAAAVDITSHQYPYKFYLSRALDLTEQQEQQTDQRSIRFSNFQGRTVLQVTGNYFAAYSDRTMNRNERVEKTYLDVMLPILQATASRLGTEPQLNAFAIEVSHHVRKQVLGVTMEHPENMALIVPRDVAGKLVAANNATEQLAALRQSSLYVDGSAVSLWPQAENQPATIAVSTPAAPVPVPPAPAPQRDLSPAALEQRLTQYQGAVDRIVHELDSQAHFVSYAPPALIAFHKASYLQLSFSTDLAASDAGSQYRVAALAFDRHVSHLIRPLLALLPQDPEFDGIVFSSTVKIAGKDSAQSVEFFLSLADLRRYEQYDLTGQQLIGTGFVLINGERVDLELQRAEADIH
ncbi:MAG TPA: hypothetical protein VEU96_18110 [Bryobacteraceae bacterium]|nr:hypothetical protein [Bryobacteraceae bacterium]